MSYYLLNIMLDHFPIWKYLDIVSVTNLGITSNEFYKKISDIAPIFRLLKRKDQVLCCAVRTSIKSGEDFAKIDLLIKLGQDVNEGVPCLYSPHIPCYLQDNKVDSVCTSFFRGDRPNLKVLKLLLKFGMNLSVDRGITREGKTRILGEIIFDRNYDLIQLSYENGFDIINALRVSHIDFSSKQLLSLVNNLGRYVNMVGGDDKQTLLFIPEIYQYITVVKQLIKLGINLNHQDVNGLTCTDLYFEVINHYSTPNKEKISLMKVYNLCVLSGAQNRYIKNGQLLKI